MFIFNDLSGAGSPSLKVARSASLPVLFLKHAIKACIFLFTIALSMAWGISSASAAITEAAPPIDALFPPFITAGGGAVIPLAQFQLIQSSGSDTLSKVGLQIVASSTMTQGEVSRVSLWKDSGAHPGFQIGEDTFIAGAASTTPLSDSTLIVLTPASAVNIGSTPSTFYLVASTTSTSGITNNHAFNVQLQTNYASTTAGSGLGTAFASNKKVRLNQSAAIKISEVKAGAIGNPSDEFVELYNSGEADINLNDLGLQLHSFYANGSSTPGIPLTSYQKIIPAHGYFLIGNQIGYSGSVPPDAVFATSSFNIILPNGGISIATSSSGSFATSTAIDYIGWGNQPAGNCENQDTIGTPCAPALPEDGTSLERLAVGFPSATSTAQSMAQGGVDATKGNGLDRNDNSAEFVIQSTPFPQNSASPAEFPFGGGGTDTSTLQVQGSFPGNGMTNAPIDMSFIGFGFNKSISTTTLISAVATTTVTLKAGGIGPNLCTSVAYNPFPSSSEPQAKCVLSAQLSPNGASYTFTVTPNVYDLSGNALDQDGFTAGNQPYTATFTTGGAGQTSANITPPMVIGVSPFSGSQNVPTNIKKVSIEFNQSAMDTSTFSSSNITMSGGLLLSGFSFGTSTGKNLLTATIVGTPSANTAYAVTIGSGVKTLQGISLPAPFTSAFTTGSSADNTAPVIVGVLPVSGTTINANTSDFVFTFDDALDPTTATSGAITLGITGGANLPGSVSYFPVAKEGHFIPSNVLPIGQALTLTIKGASIRNISNILLGSDVTKTYTVEAANSDATPPNLQFAAADDFGVAMTWNEAVNKTDATNLANYSLTVGGVSQTLSALAGHQIIYDSSTRTAKLTGLRLSAGQSFTATAQNVKDISGNLMTSPSSVTGTTASFSTTGGNVGPGSFTGSTFGATTNFSSAGIGFMPPVSVRPTSTFVSASSTYAFQLPISKRIPANGTIVITFPSSSDFGLCCTATSTTANPLVNNQNADIDGPGSDTGVVGIKTVATDSLAKTVTITLDTATRSSNSDTHDFLQFSLTNMKNPSIPKGTDSSGYVLDIKSKDASGGLLESFSANPLYIGGGTAGGGAVTTIQGTVSGNGGNLKGVNIHLMSPQTGPMDATTDASGNYSFANIPVGSQFLSNNFGGGSQFAIFTDPFIGGAGGGVSDGNGATTTAFFGNTMPTPLQATSTSIISRNFSLTPTTSAVNVKVNLTASASTFGASETVDVFAGGPGQFIVRTVTPGAGALNQSNLTTIPIPQTNGTWSIGIGPSMPKGTSGGFSGAAPSTNWSIPKPVDVTVSGCPSACVSTIGGSATSTNLFTISTADKTISGVLKDGSGNTISNADVFAYSGANGTGNHSQSSTDGSFSIKVTTGSYSVGAFSPGVGQSRQVSVVVNSSGSVFVDSSATASTGSSGANPFVIKMSKPGYTITGQVTDGTNPVGNAPVFAYQTNGQGHADAMTDSSTGNYTIYVDNGAWKVNSFIPGFGQMAEQTVTINGANQSNINFSPSSSQSFSILSGNLYEDTNTSNGFNAGEGISGAVIRLSGSSGTNEAVSGSDGAFSIRVPSGTGYVITDIFSPSYGKIAPLKDNGTAIGAIGLTASTTQNIKVPVRSTVNITVKDSNGNLVIVPKAYVDLFDPTTNLSNHVEITNASSTSMLFASSTSPKIRVYVQGVPPSNVTVASDGAATIVSSSALTISHATENIKVVINTATAALSTVSGTIYKDSATGGNELDNAWLQFTDPTNGVSFGTQATSSGTYLVTAANGTYQVLASKPGYIGAPISLTVSGTTTQNFILSSASLTISGQVTAGGSAASNAFVRAEKIGGGQAITQTDTSGNYSLSVTSGTWKVFASADGYLQGSYSNSSSVNSVAVGGNAVSGINVALTAASSLQSKLATSNTFTDTSAGSFQDTTVGVNIALDSNSFGSSGNSSYLTAKQTSNFPQTSSVNIIGSKATDINAFSGGSQIKNLQSGKKASVDLLYTKSDLTAAGISTLASANKLTIVSYSDDKKDWETLSTVATYKDGSGSVVTPASDLSNVSTANFVASGTHFSDYALSSPVGVTPPSTPTGLTAAAGAGSGGAVALSWIVSSGADGYYIYRDSSSNGSFPLLASVLSTSYSDSAVAAGTTYYYEVSAYSSSGAAESSASAAVSAKVNSPAGGGPVGGGGGGGGGGPVPRAQKVYPDGSVVYFDEPNAAAKMAVLDKKFSVTPSVAVQTSSIGSVAQTSQTETPVSAVFAKDLARGAKGADVKRLQALLEIEQSGTFGPVTEKAIKAFQLKYGIIKSEKSAAAGKLGPATRAKIAEVFKTVAAPAAPAPTSAEPNISASATISAAVPNITRRLVKGSKGNDVKALQTFLASDPAIYPEGDATGLFGPATMKAVGRFQVKYGIAKPGDAGYGEIGPKTQAKLKVMKATAQTPAQDSSAVSPTSSSTVSPDAQAALNKQIEDATKLVQQLQAQIDAANKAKSQ